jgi:hypothetical protein
MPNYIQKQEPEEVWLNENRNMKVEIVGRGGKARIINSKSTSKTTTASIKKVGQKRYFQYRSELFEIKEPEWIKIQ